MQALKLYPATFDTPLRTSHRPQHFRLCSNSPRKEIVPIREGESESDTKDVSSIKDKTPQFGSGEPPRGGRFPRPEFASEPNKISGQKTLWACGVGALASTGLALVTHFSNREVFGPANEILKPVFTFMAILLATIFGAGWLTEPNLQSIDSTSIAHSTGSIG
ncbi:MAG: hypothetical protein HYR97_02470 [Candidatus Melainabacteria bacterium]|nr:hypothetical protein [Candidatus Melainabacteria bacterium]MBI3308009.1 hypothetical protein [Candidatus Melainabacteria bacterium]